MKKQDETGIIPLKINLLVRAEIGVKSKTFYTKFDIMRKVVEVENKVVKGLKSKLISRVANFRCVEWKL